MKYLIIILLLVSCSPQKRMNRLIKKHPELVQRDTIKIIDTIYTDSIHIDTVFTLKERDTILIQKDKYWTKIVREVDTFTVDGGCLQDTIYYERLVPTEKVIYKDCPKCWIKKPSVKFFLMIGLFLLLFIIGVIVYKLGKYLFTKYLP